MVSKDLQNDPRSTVLDPHIQLELLLDTFATEGKITQAEAGIAKKLAERAVIKARKYGGR